jgi:hypothetical protein
VIVPDQYLSELIDSITVEAYGTEKQPSRFLVVFEAEVALPCVGTILGGEVEVWHTTSRGTEVDVQLLAVAEWAGVLVSRRSSTSASSLGRLRRGRT